MPIVLDANFLVALIIQHPLRDSAYELMEHWINSDKSMHTPYLALYEVNSALTKLVWANQLSQDDLPIICQALSDLPISYHPPAIEPGIIEIALVQL